LCHRLPQPQFFETFFYAASRHQLGFASAGRGADNTIARQRFNVRPFSLARSLCAPD